MLGVCHGVFASYIGERLTVFVVVTHLGLANRNSARFNGGVGGLVAILVANATGSGLGGVYGEFVDAGGGGGLVLDGVAVSSVNGVAVVRGLDAGTVLAFGNVDSRGGVVVVVALVYFNTGLGEGWSRRPGGGMVLENGEGSRWRRKRFEEEGNWY